MVKHARVSATVNRFDKRNQKPFELCIQIYSPDGQTRLEHDDYYLTRGELADLRMKIDSILDFYPKD